jgi:predicted small lipoprotein YifL
MSGWRRGSAIASLVLAALLLLTGCGKYGELEAPAGKEDTGKRVYPAL